MRLRCYLPSTSAIVIIVVVGILLLHNAASHSFAAAGLATTIVIAVGVGGLVAATLVVSAVLIRRRRAAAGACHACSHPCREAMVPLPGLDAPQWPHRPRGSLPGGQTSRMGGSRPPSPLAPVPPAVGRGRGFLFLGRRQIRTHKAFGHDLAWRVISHDHAARVIGHDPPSQKGAETNRSHDPAESAGKEARRCAGT